jgi:sugar lactone lactonase YvrE
MKYPILIGATTALFTLLGNDPVHAQLYVENYLLNTIGAYNTSGGTINSTLISDLYNGGAVGLGFYDNNLYVVNQGGAANVGNIQVYSTTGTLLNPNLLSGLNFPHAIAFDSQGFMYVSTSGNNFFGAIEKYTAAGQLVNKTLITGTGSIGHMVCDDGGNLYVSKNGANQISLYRTTGETVNAGFITGLNFPEGMALDGSGNLFVANSGSGTIGQYTTGGVAVNPALVTGLTTPTDLALDASGRLFVANGGTATPAASAIRIYSNTGSLINANAAPGVYGVIDIVIVPEPAAATMIALGLGLFLLDRRRTGQPT